MPKRAAQQYQKTSGQRVGITSISGTDLCPSLRAWMRVLAERALTEERIAGFAIVIANLCFWTFLFLWLR